MEENQDKERRVKESEKNSSWFDKLIFKMMDFLGFTSGSGIVGIGGFWFIYSALQYIFTTPENVTQEIIIENYFNQAQLGILIMEIKKMKLE